MKDRWLLLGLIALSAFPAAAIGGEPQNERGLSIPADLSGIWYGAEWGTVVLHRTRDGAYEGTYSDTFGKDTGRIKVGWSAESRRYEGDWGEGKHRFGRIALHLVDGGRSIRGAYTADPKCEYRPGVPSLADLQWEKTRNVRSDDGPGQYRGVQRGDITN